MNRSYPYIISSSYNTYSSDFKYSLGYSGNLSKFSEASNNYVPFEDFSAGYNAVLYTYQNRIIVVNDIAHWNYNNGNYLYDHEISISVLIDDSGSLLTIDNITINTTSKSSKMPLKISPELTKIYLQYNNSANETVLMLKVVDYTSLYVFDVEFLAK